MEPSPKPVDEASPQVELPRPGHDASIVVLTMLAALLLVVVFLLLTSGSAAP